jgi:hypothetical protein
MRDLSQSSLHLRDVIAGTDRKLGSMIAQYFLRKGKQGGNALIGKRVHPKPPALLTGDQTAIEQTGEVIRGIGLTETGDSD